MRRSIAMRRGLWGILSILILLAPQARAQGPPRVTFVRVGGRLRIEVGGEAFATYVFRDEKILRPYFAHVRVPGDVPVTRNLPPIAGIDPADHDTMHPGIWLAFGDINGVDFWRNKGRVEHEQFTALPQGGTGQGSFAVRNRYVAGPGAPPVCVEDCRVTVSPGRWGVLLIVDSTFSSPDHDLAFGAQEEMGFGVRVATPIAVKQGGRLLNSDGLVGESQAWGKHADWCDYSGAVRGKDAGITLMTDPESFRKGWFHVRDYGLMVANPIERSAKKSEPARLVVPRGEPLRLRFGVLIHRGSADSFGPKAAYREFLGEIKGRKGPGTP